MKFFSAISKKIITLIVERLSVRLLALLFFPSGSLFAQVALDLSEAQATYTIEVARQIEWPAQYRFKSHRIGIVGQNTSLLNAFKKRQTQDIGGLNFEVEIVPVSDIDYSRYTIVFVTNSRRVKASEFIGKSSQALLVVDGRVSQQDMMINLQTEGERIKLRFNRELLTERGFKVSSSLIDFAGTREDLSEELKDREARLKLLLARVTQKEKELISLTNKLQLETQKLKDAEVKNSHNEEILKNYRLQAKELQQKIELSQDEVTRNELLAQKQIKLVESTRKEMESKEALVRNLGKSIEENKKILIEQVSKIESQNKVIKNKNETIDEQRSWLKANIFVLTLFVILSFVLWKINSLRQKANDELKSLNEKLFQLATTDGLTGLFNRRHFLESAQNELSRSRRNKSDAALLMIDIDYFKQVNDSYGHLAGDLVIKNVADALKLKLRKYDIIGRLGGEEFAMMLMDCDFKKAKDIAERACDNIQTIVTPFESDKISVSVSIGLTQLTASDTKIEQAMQRADKALYQAKDQGRNQVVIYYSTS